MAASHATAPISHHGKAPPPATVDRHRPRGGWTATSFSIVTTFLMTLAFGCWLSNLIVFLINDFNIKTIKAVKIINIISGCMNFFPLIGAIVADSLLGCFSVIWISSLISLLGSILLMLIVTVDGLMPPPCQQNSCATPSALQYAMLYSSMALLSIGIGGNRFTLATMGANQFTKLSHQSTYFNWFFFCFYSACFIASTAIVYVEDNVGWVLGFGIGTAVNAIGLVAFLGGSRYYVHDQPKTSPFTSFLRVVVASFRKRKTPISSEAADYYFGDGGVKGLIANPPITNTFRSLNRAALYTEGDLLPDGSIAHPWRLCSVEQVEDLKSLIRVLPLWSSSIFLGTPIGVQLSLTVIQALVTDRHVTRSFKFPASSIIVFSFLSTALGVPLITHCFYRPWKSFFGRAPTPLQQIGIGHVFNVASMAVSALVESRRRSSGGEMSVAWLFPQMVIVGVGEAFHFPGQVGLYYREFPASLKSLATAMVAMLIGVAFYLSAGLIDLIRRVTDWLPDNINQGRVDCVYWAMVVIGVVNFGYYLVISWFYSYNNIGEDVKDDHDSGDLKQ